MYGGDAIESDGQEDDAEITQVCTHLTSSLPRTLLFVLSVQATLLRECAEGKSYSTAPRRTP